MISIIIVVIFIIVCLTHTIQGQHNMQILRLHCLSSIYMSGKDIAISALIHTA